MWMPIRPGPGPGPRASGPRPGLRATGPGPGPRRKRAGQSDSQVQLPLVFTELDPECGVLCRAPTPKDFSYPGGAWRPPQTVKWYIFLSQIRQRSIATEVTCSVGWEDSPFLTNLRIAVHARLKECKCHYSRGQYLDVSLAHTVCDNSA